MQLARWLPGILPLGALALAACGSRTGLLVSGDVASNVPSPGGDASDVPGTGDDAGPLQVTPPPPSPPLCADAGVQVFYVVTSSNSLLEFDPASNSFRFLGTIACPGMGGSTPFSMAVDRNGTAYTVFGSGDFYELRPSASGVTCTPIVFSRGSTGINSTFGMGFTKDDVGTGETLYVVASLAPYELARVPIPGFTAQAIGAPTGLVHPELTGNGAGALYAFSGADCTADGNCSTSSIAQLDKTTGQVVGLDLLNDLPQGGGWAFGFWGGDFYIFTAPTSAGSLVTRFDPSTRSMQTVNQYREVIVGAGVSTCAPLETP